MPTVSLTILLHKPNGWTYAEIMIDRRSFIHAVGGSLSSALLLRPNALMAASNNKERQSFTIEEWKTVDAICAQILPPVNTIDTRQAGCTNFIDKTLAHEDKHLLSFYQLGLRSLNHYAALNRGAIFHELASTAQIALLEALEDATLATWDAGETVPQTAFFQTLRFHTLLGFLAAPKFGGNQNRVGWQAVGFPGHTHENGFISDAMVEGSADHQNQS